jgi:hypothetical protein
MTGKDSDEPIQRDPITRSSGGNVPPPAREEPGTDDEQASMSSTDTEPSSPHGVGESITGRGERMTQARGKEPGRKDVGREGKAQRPAGTSDSRDSTGVDPDD